MLYEIVSEGIVIAQFLHNCDAEMFLEYLEGQYSDCSFKLRKIK